MFNPKLELGKAITNDELRATFVCGNMGGMRRSKTTNTLVIISDHTKGLYEDKWFGDTLHYIGMGKKGDQDINEVFERKKYIYRGQVKLSETPYQEKQKDEDGILRTVWVFPVKVVDNDGSII